MQNKLNKRGLAEVVQVLVITALSILAITTISSYVFKLTSGFESQLSPAVDCLTMKSAVIKACVNKNNQIESFVTVLEEKTTLNLNYKDNIFQCSTNADICSTCKLNSGSTQIIYLSSESQVNAGEELVYQFNSCLAQKVKITACEEP